MYIDSRFQGGDELSFHREKWHRKDGMVTLISHFILVTLCLIPLHYKYNSSYNEWISLDSNFQHYCQKSHAKTKVK